MISGRSEKLHDVSALCTELAARAALFDAQTPGARKWINTTVRTALRFTE